MTEAMEDGQRLAITLADVAQAAGVSLATASKALNGKREVNVQTRHRIEEVARTLGFFPNQQARSLMAGRTGSVGLLTDDLQGRFVLPVMAGAEDALGEQDAVAIMVNAGGSDDAADRHLVALLSRRVDGIIRVGDSTEPVEPLTRPVRVPVVYAYAPSSRPGDTSVLCDHRGGGRLAAQHLLGLGRRRIAHIGGPTAPGAPGRTAALLRAAGTEDALAAADVRPAGGGPVFGADWTETWGWQAVDRLLAEGTPLDGLVCANDLLARGAIDRLITAGRRVPEDVAVIGFDNWSPFASEARLPQSSIDLNLPQIGRVAALAVLNGRIPPSEELVVPGRVVERASTIGRRAG